VPTGLSAAVAYVAGPDLVFEFASDGYRQILGGSELIGRPFREAVPEVAGRPRSEALRQVLQTGEPCEALREEVRVRRPGKEPGHIQVDSVYQPVHDEAGRVSGVLIFMNAVSDRVQDRREPAEPADSLQRSEERYRMLFETLPDAIVHYDLDGSLIGADRSAAEILGVAPGHTAADRARHTLHEDGTPYRPDDLPAMVALRTGEVVSGEVVGVRNPRTGEVSWIRITAVPIARDAQGKPRRVYSLLTDVTEQRRAQAGLRESTRLLGRLRDANVLGVAAGTEEGIQEANDAFLDIIGYTRADLVAGRISWEAITPPDGAHTDHEIVEQLRRTGACPPYDKEYLHRDGHRVPVVVGAAVLERDPLRWTAFVVDLTARQRAERAEQERAELPMREQAVQVAADAAQDRLGLLLNASNLIAPGSQEELRERLSQLLVPALADSCTVLLPAGKGCCGLPRWSTGTRQRPRSLKN
jgi:PAS domain S-box-containing protein